MNNKNTKTIYYAIQMELEVPEDTTEDDIDNILAALATENGTLDEGRDYMWSDKPNLFN